MVDFLLADYDAVRTMERMTATSDDPTEASLLEELHAAVAILRPDRDAARRRAALAITALRELEPGIWSFRRLSAEVGMSTSELFRMHQAHAGLPDEAFDYDAPASCPATMAE